MQTGPSRGVGERRGYKAQVQNLQNSIGLVERLRGVRFVWETTDKPSLGLIAEVVAEAIPGLVRIDRSSGQAEAVNYSALTAVLIEAVKEQQEQIRRQQNEIESLRAQLNRLETLEAQFVQMKSLLSELHGSQGLPAQVVYANGTK